MSRMGVWGNALLTLFLLATSTPTRAIELPDGFVQDRYVDNLRTPSTIEFGPNGRLLIAERVVGEIRLVRRNGTVREEPVVSLDTPRKENGELPGGRGYLSSGTRDFAFDPAYPDEPYLYVFYMKNSPRHNRVSRFRIHTDSMTAVTDSEQVLIEVPFADDRSSGSHNGGAVLFGQDGMLYFTTGDGWQGGDPVQSLQTFTGKAFRIRKDGSIPEDNPFYDETEGAFRAIWAVGFRNPFSMSRHPETGRMYVNDCAGPRKANIYRLKGGGNYRYSRKNGHRLVEWEEDFPGKPHDPYVNGAAGKWGRLITGGAWYPEGGSFPRRYWGNYFVVLWGSNANTPGTITRVRPRSNPEVTLFASRVDGKPDPKNDMAWLTSGTKPVYTAVGPDGALYWLSTTYRTPHGTVYRISHR